MCSFKPKQQSTPQSLLSDPKILNLSGPLSILEM